MSHGTIAILVASDYEDLEVWYPKLRLEEAGYSTLLVGLGEDSYKGKHGYPCKVDKSVKEVKAAELLGVLAPGGWAPDRIRRDSSALLLVRELHRAGKLVATICHGPWVLISAGIVKGKKMTSTPGIHDDLANAGAEWLDEPAVVDGNIVSARVPRDLPAFMVAMLKVLEKQRQSGAVTLA